jgi:hypothetical protein
MKTRNFTLYVTILVMGAVMTAAGQPARGDRNGNHENNNRKEIKSDNDKAVQGNPNIRYNGNSSEKGRATQEMRVNKNVTSREQSKQPDRQANNSKNRNVGEKSDNYANNQSVRENRSGNSDKLDDNKNRGGNTNNAATTNNNKNHGGYADNRNYKENPAPNHREYNRNHWDNGNYSRNEWEHRNYNWNDRNWNFSNYYRKDYVPYYFRNNRNYWYFPEYGHILRGFLHDPFLFYSGSIPFYFEDGFFFRHYNGIGYVWIEDPHDIWFNELPYSAVRVRIGGRIYFRLGNAYFEGGPLGFHLAILPDRYYDPYYDRGVSFEISARF